MAEPRIPMPQALYDEFGVEVTDKVQDFVRQHVLAEREHIATALRDRELRALLTEARAALEPLTLAQIKLHHIKRDLADRIDAALGVIASGEAQPQSDLIRALELGRAHAKWSVDRSTDAIERRINQRDLDRIDVALAAARGVPGLHTDQGENHG